MASLSVPRLARTGVLPVLFDSVSISVLAAPATGVFLALLLWKFPLAGIFSRRFLHASSVALLKRPSLTATSAILRHTLDQTTLPLSGGFLSVFQAGCSVSAVA